MVNQTSWESVDRLVKMFREVTEHTYIQVLSKCSCIQDVVKFIYCGKLDKLGENAAELFKAADMYQMDNLKGKNYTSQIIFYWFTLFLMDMKKLYLYPKFF